MKLDSATEPDRLLHPTLESGVGSAEQEGRDAPSLELVNVAIDYPSRDGKGQFRAVADVSMTVMPGEFVAVVGPSGCGKSSLLMAAAGLHPIGAGTISARGKEIQGPGRDRGVVFQHASLFPWRTTIKNVAYGLLLAGVDDAVTRAREFIELVGLKGFESNYPHELSGGMQQRANLARALAWDPATLLMDEPFASLDAQTRTVMQGELLRIWQATKKSVLFITHQIDEAVFLADRVVVLSPGPNSRVVEVVESPFARPRDESTRQSPEFMSCVANIWERIRARPSENETKDMEA